MFMPVAILTYVLSIQPLPASSNIEAARVVKQFVGSAEQLAASGHRASDVRGHLSAASAQVDAVQRYQQALAAHTQACRLERASRTTRTSDGSADTTDRAALRSARLAARAALLSARQDVQTALAPAQPDDRHLSLLTLQSAGVRRAKIEYKATERTPAEWRTLERAMLVSQRSNRLRKPAPAWVTAQLAAAESPAVTSARVAQAANEADCESSLR